MALAYKKNFKVTPALQLFYSGGPLRLSPDGSVVACACGDEVKLISVNTGLVIRTIPGDSEPITALAFTPDGESLFAASRSIQVKHWDLSSDSCRRAWKPHEGAVSDMSVDASGGLVATASSDRIVRVWDIDGGYCTHSFQGHTGVVTRVTFHPDPHRLLLFSGGDDATVRVWDLVTKKCAAVLNKHFSAITSFSFSTNGWNLLSGARDKVVNMWNLRDYSHEATIPVYEAIESLCVIPDGCSLPGSMPLDATVKRKKSAKPRFLAVGEFGRIRVFDAERSSCIYEHKSSDASSTASDDNVKRGYIAAYILPQAQGIMCVTGDQRLLFYEPIQPEDGNAELRISKRFIGYNDEVTDLRFIGDDDTLLAVASNIEQIRLYDLASMTCFQELYGHSDIVLCMDACVASNGQALLASGAKDHTVRLWDTNSGICIATAAGHMGAVAAVAFSKKYRNFLVTGSNDRTIKLWGLEKVLEGTGNPNAPHKLSSKAVVAAHDKDINSIAVAPNDSLVCSGSQDGTARVWKLPELIIQKTLRGHKRGVWSVEFSPVDQCVLTASGDKTLKIWALSDGSCLKTFEGHTASVLRASFLSRGTQVISSGADGLLKLWTIKSNECVNTFDHHEDKVWALTVCSKNEILASGGSDSLVNLWVDCTAADEDEAAKQEAEEALKDQDLSNALADTDYEKAIQLAFELRRPFKLLHVFTEMFRNNGGDAQAQRVLKLMGKEYIHLLFSYVRDWNTKSRFCHVAQRVLFHVLNVFPPTELVKVTGIREVLEGIIPYTQRHFNRMDRLARNCFLIDYTLACMSVLTPTDDDTCTAEVSCVHPLAEGVNYLWDSQQAAAGTDVPPDGKKDSYLGNENLDVEFQDKEIDIDQTQKSEKHAKIKKYKGEVKEEEQKKKKKTKTESLTKEDVIPAVKEQQHKKKSKKRKSQAVDAAGDGDGDGIVKKKTKKKKTSRKVL